MSERYKLRKERLSAFETGVLVVAVLRKYKGRGKPMLILHEAKAEKRNTFSYGAKRCWTVNPRSLKLR